jgi:hypothetical protein
MILPAKHIRFAESLLGLGGKLLTFVKQPMTVDEIWREYSKVNNDKKKFPAYHSFDNVVLALNLLYVIGAIEITPEGKVHNETNRTQSQSKQLSHSDL